MTTNRSGKYVTPLIILLIAVTTVSGILAWSRYRGNQYEEISISNPPSQAQVSQIYIGGAVNNPGFYPLTDGDSIEAIIQAAGGTLTNATPAGIKLYIPEAGEEESQKININRAEVWLLEALPGIGETKAEGIIAYRQQHGPFRNISELIKVEGIGTATYEQIKSLVTVAD